MITREAIETAYCLFHQKERVYSHSSMEWQRDDIEYAVASYVDSMAAQLYRAIAQAQPDFLLSHPSFGTDLQQAVARLEQMLNQRG